MKNEIPPKKELPARYGTYEQNSYFFDIYHLKFVEIVRRRLKIKLNDDDDEEDDGSGGRVPRYGTVLMGIEEEEEELKAFQVGSWAGSYSPAVISIQLESLPIRTAGFEGLLQ